LDEYQKDISEIKRILGMEEKMGRGSACEKNFGIGDSDV
jgi:hypothetical protein